MLLWDAFLKYSCQYFQISADIWVRCTIQPNPRAPLWTFATSRTPQSWWWKPHICILGLFSPFFLHLYVFQSIHSQMKAKFTVDDHRHYLFTPCILTEWVLSLLRYDLTAGNKKKIPSSYSSSSYSSFMGSLGCILVISNLGVFIHYNEVRVDRLSQCLLLGLIR